MATLRNNYTGPLSEHVGRRVAARAEYVGPQWTRRRQCRAAANLPSRASLGGYQRITYLMNIFKSFIIRTHPLRDFTRRTLESKRRPYEKGSKEHVKV